MARAMEAKAMEMELKSRPGSTPTGMASTAQGESIMFSHGLRMNATSRM